MASEVDPFLADLREVYGRIAYTHKTHEKEADLNDGYYRQLKTVNVVVFAITAAAALVAPLVDSQIAAWVAAIAATVGLVFTAIQLSFDPAAAISSQRLAAKAYLALRNDYVALIGDTLAQTSSAVELRTRRDELRGRQKILDELAPRTSTRAYTRAQSALKNAEELTFSDSELDLLLPPGLRSDPTGQP